MEHRSHLGARLLTAVTAAAGLACAGSAVRGSEEAAVRRELEAYYQHLSARDWTAFADHFWPGADLTTVWQPPGEHRDRVVVTSIESFIHQAPEGPGSKAIFEEWIIDSDVHMTGNLAQVWVRYGARFGDPGEVMEWEGVDAVTLLKHDDRWRIAALVFLSDDQETQDAGRN